MTLSVRSSLAAVVMCVGLVACDSPSSDLSLDSVASQDKDAQYTLGEVIKLSASLKNSGSDDSALGTVQVYRSVDSSITVADAHLGQYNVQNIEAGSTQSADVPVATGGWDPGHYFIAVCESRRNTVASTGCETVEVDVLASATLTGLVPGALLVNRQLITADAEGNETVSIGQTLTFNTAATDTYSVAVYRSESIDRDDTAAQIGFFNIAKGDEVWREELDTSSWPANKMLYLSACWANGGLANNLNDCYQMAAQVRVSRPTN